MRGCARQRSAHYRALVKPGRCNCSAHGRDWLCRQRRGSEAQICCQALTHTADRMTGLRQGGSGTVCGTDPASYDRINGQRACCCDGPCGAVSELDRPSWLMAAPLTTTALPGQLLSASPPASGSSGLRPRVMQASPREYL